MTVPSSAPPGKETAKALIERMLKRIAASKGELAGELALSPSALFRRLGPRYPHDLFSEGEIDTIVRFLDMTPAQRALLLRCYGHGGEELPQARRPASGAESAMRPPAEVADKPTPAPALVNLPPTLTSFVGRAHERSVVAGLLAGSRLVTLTGAGGSGKTRLARVVAADCAGRYHDGVWVIELAGLTSPALAPQVVAATLGVRESDGQGLLPALTAHLRDRTLLLVLDNCEHVLEAGAALVQELLRAAPGLSILATSREKLAVPGETAWSVPPLSLPAERLYPRLDGRRAIDRGGALASDAVQLFLERARSVRPTLVIDDRTVSLAADLCRRLDGLPLAIELAAARLRVLPLSAIAERLSGNLGLLADPGREGPAHHRTLRAAIDWSYESLADVERAAFRALAVFAGGFTLAAAEAVLAGAVPDASAETAGIDPLPPSDLPVLAARPEVLDLLAALVDKSLVSVEEGDTGRFRMLEPLRQYAAERLEEAPPIPWAGGVHREADILRIRHAEWCLHLAEQGDRGLRGSQQPEWVARLAEERENLRAALAWCAAHPTRGGVGLRLAAALALFWDMSGSFSEARAHLDTQLRTGAGPDRVRLRAMIAAGNLAVRQSDHIAARGLYTDARALAEQAGDRLRLSLSLTGLGLLSYLQGDYEQAHTRFEETLALQQELGNRTSVGATLSNLGLVALARGDYREARARFEESLVTWRALGDRWQSALALHNLGIVLEELGDADGAWAMFEACAALRGELGDRRGGADTLACLARLDMHAGRIEAARTRAEESLAIARELGDRMGALATTITLGLIARSTGEHDQEYHLFNMALAEARALDDRRTIVQALTHLGEAALALGDHDEARAATDEALGIARTLGHRRRLAAALAAAADMALADSNTGPARLLLFEAVTLWQSMESRPGLARTLPTVAAYLADSGHLHDAARMIGAARLIDHELGRRAADWEAAILGRAARAVQAHLSEDEYATAVGEGLELGPDAIAPAVLAALCLDA